MGLLGDLISLPGVLAGSVIEGVARLPEEICDGIEKGVDAVSDAFRGV